MLRKSLVSLILTMVVAASAVADTKIKDVTRLRGQRTNRLMGMGLVVGLKGTGDGGDYMPAMRPLQSMLERYANPVAVSELKNAKNVAIVAVEAMLPEFGVRAGDQVDVQVTSLGAAGSLMGGRLLPTPLLGPDTHDPRIYALASGSLYIPDVTVSTTASIRRGATLEEDVIHQYIADNKITLVLEHPQADWSWAKTIADIINEDNTRPGRHDTWAIAVDPKNVVVEIPPEERSDPAGFIARLENLRLLMPESEARVVINRKSKTIVITGDVEIAPVVISHHGLTITVTEPPREPDPANPTIRQETFVGLSTPQTQRGIKLADLRDQLNLLKVPAEDQIEIIEELYRSGRLYARLVVEE